MHEWRFRLCILAGTVRKENPYHARTFMSEESSDSGGEYERQPVPNSALLGNGKFWGMYAGEHAAGTEFMIGPLFLAAGASLSDLLLGLLLGNLLAVLILAIPGCTDRHGKTVNAVLSAGTHCRRFLGQVLQFGQRSAILLSGWGDGDRFGIRCWSSIWDYV